MLLATCYLQHATCFLLLVTYYLLFALCFLLFASCILLLDTYHLQLGTFLRVTFFLLLSARKHDGKKERNQESKEAKKQKTKEWESKKGRKQESKKARKQESNSIICSCHHSNSELISSWTTLGLAQPRLVFYFAENILKKKWKFEEKKCCTAKCGAECGLAIDLFLFSRSSSKITNSCFTESCSTKKCGRISPEIYWSFQM